jgi:hypothetical protein
MPLEAKYLYMLGETIANEVGSITVEGLTNAKDYPIEVKIYNRVYKTPKLDHYDGSDNYFIDTYNVDRDVMYPEISWLMKNSKKLTLWTGSTCSELKPQMFLQRMLLDLNIDYEASGDGVIDFRNKKDLSNLIIEDLEVLECGAAACVFKSFIDGVFELDKILLIPLVKTDKRDLNQVEISDLKESKSEISIKDIIAVFDYDQVKVLKSRIVEPGQIYPYDTFLTMLQDKAV